MVGQAEIRTSARLATELNAADDRMQRFMSDLCRARLDYKPVLPDVLSGQSYLGLLLRPSYWL